MLQVVFSESEWGTLKMATHCRPSSWDDGVIGFIFGDGEKEPTQEEKDQVMARFKAKREKENRRAQAILEMYYAHAWDWTSAPSAALMRRRPGLICSQLGWGATFPSRTATRMTIPSGICSGNNASETGSGF